MTDASAEPQRVTGSARRLSLTGEARSWHVECAADRRRAGARPRHPPPAALPTSPLVRVRAENIILHALVVCCSDVHGAAAPHAHCAAAGRPDGGAEPLRSLVFAIDRPSPAADRAPDGSSRHDSAALIVRSCREDQIVPALARAHRLAPVAVVAVVVVVVRACRPARVMLHPVE